MGSNLRYTIDKLARKKKRKKLQASSSKQQAAWHLSWDIVGYDFNFNERNIVKEILFEDLKKGDWIKHSHLGSSPLVGGYIMESPRQGRGLKSTILVDVKGTEVGMFDEIGSIYANQIAAVRRDGEWYRVDQKRLNPMICFPNAMLANL